MKKLFLLSALISAFLAKSQTSVYHPFPDSNACWNINMSQGMCYMWGWSDEEYSITYSGDTIINGITYHKLSTPFVEFSFTGGCTQENFPGYKGAIRQDIPAKKVYFVPPADSDEQLLYDFTMEVGDTVKGYLQLYFSPNDIVSEIDSVLVGVNYHKRWLLNSCYDNYLIEGVGSTYGLLAPSPGCATDMDYYTISCLNLNGESVYPDASTECLLITSSDNNIPIDKFVHVFPNPSNGSFIVEFARPEEIREISLTNLIGNTIFKELTNNRNTMYFSDLPGGYYILTITCIDSRLVNLKIINCQ